MSDQSQNGTGRKQKKSKRGRNPRRRPVHKHRHAARTFAMQALFESDLSSHSLEEVTRRIIIDDDVNATTAEYFKRLVTGIAENQDEIDSLISDAAPAYPLDQIAPIDRNVLRIAVYELQHESSVPTKAIINEAVEIAKQFGGEHSSKFVNGVAGSIARSTRPPDSERAAEEPGPEDVPPPESA